MPTNQRGLIVRNIFFLTVGEGSSRVLYGLIAILLIRYLGKASFNQYATAISFMAVFSILPCIGFHNVMLRECSQDITKTSKYFSATLVWNILLAIGGFSLGSAIAYFRFDRIILLLSLILGARLFIVAMLPTFHTVFQAYQRMHVTSILIIISNMAAFIAICLAMLLHGSLFTVVILLMFASILTVIIAVIITLKVVTFIFSGHVFMEMVKPAFWFGINNIMSMLYIQGNVFVLTIYNMQSAVGTFNAAFRLVAMFELIPQIISTALFPAVYARSHDDNQLISAVHQVMRYLAPAGILIATVCSVYSEWIIVTLFTREFEKSVPIFVLLSIGVVFRFNLIIFSNVLYAKRKERYLTILMSFLTVTSLVACVFLAPLYGAMGVACVYLGVQFLFWIINMIWFEVMFNNPKLWRHLVKPGIAGLAVIGLGCIAKNLSLVAILVSPLLYYGTLIVTRYYSVGEIVSLFRASIRRN